jgi:prolyl-tRNA editing enzyme YbaK/EbsC (Cys-tRNA(Pro) deacylase)
MSDLSPNAQKVQSALSSFGLELQVLELPDTTRTAVDAANAIGCQVAQIVKSLVFRRKNTGAAIFIVASGVNRVNEKSIAKIINEPIEKADADFVRQYSGFPIGGVPPLGHVTPMETFIDQDLMQLNSLWAAAGTPNAVFQLTPADLVKITGGKIITIT